MPKITIELTDERYAALAKTQELMALVGGKASTPKEYAQFVMDGACDSYAHQYNDETPEGLAAQEMVQKEAEILSAAKEV